MPSFSTCHDCHPGSGTDATDTLPLESVGTSVEALVVSAASAAASEDEKKAQAAAEERAAALERHKLLHARTLSLGSIWAKDGELSADEGTSPADSAPVGEPAPTSTPPEKPTVEASNER